jgi:Mg-chelatase subunit ChlD
MTTTTNHPYLQKFRDDLAEETRERLVAEARLRALTRDLRTALRILDSSISDLRVVEDGPAPAWTDFSEVFLNSGSLPGTRTLREVATWAGATYHELGHIIFSPRPSSSLWELVQRLSVVRPSAFNTLNLVEDQRQERAMVDRFSPLRGYFSAVVVELILRDGDVSESWPLITGRTYLPAETRRMVRDAWVKTHGETSATRVASLVGEFQSLRDPGETDSARAAEIVRELDEVLSEALGSETPPGGCGSPADQRPGTPAPSPDSDSPTAESEDESLSSPSPDEDSDEDSDEDGDSEGDSGEGDSEEDSDEDSEGASDGEGDSEEDSDSDSDSSSPTDSDEDSDEDGEDEDSDSASDSAGTSSSDEDSSSDEELREALSEAVSEVLSSEDIAEELRDLAEGIDSGPGGERERVSDLRQATPTNSARTAREELSESLRDLRAAAESEWIIGTDSGRVNVSRVAAARASGGFMDPSTLFDRFTPDSLDSVSVEVVVLVDLSGSMRHNEGEASEAVWSIHHAAAAAEARLSVFGFNSGPARTLVSPEDLPTESVPVLYASGGTDPSDALRAAWDTFRGSEASHRILVTLSDGDWNREEQSRAIVRGMREDGVSTLAAVFLSSRYGDEDEILSHHSHGAERFVRVNSLRDFSSLVAEEVREAMRDGLGR